MSKRKVGDDNTDIIVEENEKVKKKKFSLNRKLYFLTASQIADEMTKEIALENIIKRLKDKIDYAIVSEESHIEEGKHLHMCLMFKKAHSIRSEVAFDFIANKHPNIKEGFDLKGLVQYITKHDKSPAQYNIDYTSILNNKGKGDNLGIQAKISAAVINDNASFNDLYRQFPVYVGMNGKKIKELLSINKRYNHEVKQKKKFMGIKTDGLMGSLLRVSEWINLNFKDINKEREFKQPQLYIYGPPDHGKSYLFTRRLEEYFNRYQIPNERFNDLYDDDSYDYAVRDEFRDTDVRDMDWWNLWLEGSIMTLAIKGSQRIKYKNIPTIIISNYSPYAVYSKFGDKAETFTRRLEVIELEQTDYLMDLEFIKEDEIDDT